MKGTDSQTREAKHMTILSGLDRLIRARKKLRGLFDEIVGNVEDESVKPEAEKGERLYRPEIST